MARSVSTLQSSLRTLRQNLIKAGIGIFNVDGMHNAHKNWCPLLSNPKAISLTCGELKQPKLSIAQEQRLILLTA